LPDAPATTEPVLDRDALDRLVEAVAARDRSAFASLFNFYAPRVKAYLIRLNANDSLAEELTQEVMLTVWRKAGQFDSRQASASTWIFRIARNRRIDAARRAAKPALDEADPSLHPTSFEAPDEAAHAGARDARVREAAYRRAAGNGEIAPAAGLRQVAPGARCGRVVTRDGRIGTNWGPPLEAARARSICTA